MADDNSQTKEEADNNYQIWEKLQLTRVRFNCKQLGSEMGKSQIHFKSQTKEEANNNHKEKLKNIHRSQTREESDDNNKI